MSTTTFKYSKWLKVITLIILSLSLGSCNFYLNYPYADGIYGEPKQRSNTVFTDEMGKYYQDTDVFIDTTYQIAQQTPDQRTPSVVYQTNIYDTYDNFYSNNWNDPFWYHNQAWNRNRWSVGFGAGWNNWNNRWGYNNFHTPYWGWNNGFYYGNSYYYNNRRNFNRSNNYRNNNRNYTKRSNSNNYRTNNNSRSTNNTQKQQTYRRSNNSNSYNRSNSNNSTTRRPSYSSQRSSSSRSSSGTSSRSSSKRNKRSNSNSYRR